MKSTKIDLSYAITVILGEIYVVAFVTAIKLAIDWTKQRQYLAATSEMLLENELKYLKLVFLVFQEKGKGI